MKNPLVLAILNFITLGLGTVILGRRTLYGLLMFIGGSMVRYEELRIAPAVTGAFNIHWLVMTLGLSLVGIALAREVHAEAKAAA